MTDRGLPIAISLESAEPTGSPPEVSQSCTSEGATASASPGGIAPTPAVSQLFAPDPSVKRHLLIADDEPSVLRMLEVALQAPDRVIKTADTGRDALSLAVRWLPDLVVLDLLMPDIDGYEVCRALRAFTTSPVILLTAVRSARSAALGLEAGADEYITKPFSVAELRSHATEALRRREALPAGFARRTLAFDRGRLVFDGSRQVVLVDDQVVPLCNLEYRMLLHLGASSGRLVGFDELLERDWGFCQYGQEEAMPLVKLHARLLCRRLAGGNEKPRYVAEVDGLGLRFTPR